MKIITNELGDTAKMAAMLIWVKNILNFFFSGTNWLEAWYVASGTHVLPRLFKR